MIGSSVPEKENTFTNGYLSLSQSEIYALLLGRKEVDRKFLLCLFLTAQNNQYANFGVFGDVIS